MMMYLKWFVLAVTTVLLSLIGKVLAPLMVLFASEDGYLPRWLSWAWGQFDADLDEGARVGHTPSRWRYWSRVRWLQRNAAYNFAYWIAGQKWDLVWNAPKVFIDEPHCLLMVHRWPTGFGVYYHGTFGQLKLGWKAFNVIWRTEPWGPEWRVPICLTYSPFKRR